MTLRTLLVGIDGACDRILAPLFDEGVVPTLESIYRDGTSTDLESQIPPWTASAWPSLYTGKNPGKHGVFGFLAFDGYDWDVVNASDVREPTIWELLDRYGHSSVVVNAPVTHPPRPFDGALVPGYTAPESPTCHPAGLLDELREELGAYRVYPDESKPLARGYADCVRMRGEAFRSLTDRFDPDFGFLEFQATDSIFHEAPDDQAAIRTIYEALDRQLAATLEACEPANVIVASDHGMGPYRGTEFRVNSYLREAGFLETRQGGDGMPTWATVRDDALKAGESAEAHTPSLGERLMAGAAGVGLTSQRIARGLERVGLADAVAAHTPSAIASAGATQVEFAASRAAVRSRIECGVRLNVAGREPDGVVAPENYETVRTQLIDALRSVETPDGEPVFEAVRPREQYFHGPESDRAVDVVTVPADFDHFLSATLRVDQFGQPTEPWNHKLEGTFAARGADIDHAAGLTDAHLFDVAPTVLATFGVPAGDRMDGTTLSCVPPVGERSYPRYHGDRTVETADAGVEQRLADLGYLE